MMSSAACMPHLNPACAAPTLYSDALSREKADAGAALTLHDLSCVVDRAVDHASLQASNLGKEIKGVYVYSLSAKGHTRGTLETCVVTLTNAPSYIQVFEKN